MTIGLRLAAWAVVPIVCGAQTPARDSAAVPAAARAGTAVVSGIVVSEGVPTKPLRRATVSLVSPDLRVPLSTVTDDAGRFVFSGVPAGTYNVAASKPAYVGAFYGSPRPGRGPGVPVAVGDGQRVSNLTLTLIGGGVIAGTLKLPSGEPAAGMSVTVVEIDLSGGARGLGFAGGRATTDDRGQYRVYGLSPGDYLVQAQPSGLLSGALSGASDARQTTASEVSWAASARNTASAGGVANGRSAGGPPLPDHGKTMNYATVFFPGTADPSGAMTVTVGRSEERSDIDFALALVPTARVSGIVLSPDGRPLQNAQLSLATADDTLGIASLVAARPAIKSGPDGSFVVPAVAPGHYILSARAFPAVDPAAATAARAGTSGLLWASSELSVDGQALTDLVLSMQAGTTVSGRIVLASSGAGAATPDDMRRVRVTVTPAFSGNSAIDAIVSTASRATPAGTVAGAGAAGAAAANGAGMITANVADDGTFTVVGLVPGTYRIAFSVPGGVWSLRSAVVRDADVADRPLEITPRGNVDGLLATFTDRPTDLSGTLTDQANRPAPGYPIVVFSTDRRDWTPGSRRVADVRPSTDGAFRLVGLPAGSYYLSAVVDLDRSDLDDPSFLDQLVRTALTITLIEGHATVQNFKLAGGTGF